MNYILFSNKILNQFVEIIHDLKTRYEQEKIEMILSSYEIESLDYIYNAVVDLVNEIYSVDKKRTDKEICLELISWYSFINIQVIQKYNYITKEEYYELMRNNGCREKGLGNIFMTYLNSLLHNIDIYSSCDDNLSEKLSEIDNKTDDYQDFFENYFLEDKTSMEEITSYIINIFNDLFEINSILVKHFVDIMVNSINGTKVKTNFFNYYNIEFKECL